MQKLNYFLTTREPTYIYNYIVNSSKKNCEKINNKELNFLIFKKKKIPSIKYLLFFLYIILSGKIFKSNRSQISFENIVIGRYVIPSTFYTFESYVNKFILYKSLIKNFFFAGSLLKTCESYYKKYDINGAYIDHCGYLNGIIFSFFAKKKSIIYTNNYPHGIYFVNYNKNKKKYLSKYENSLRINLKKKINKSQKKKSEKKLFYLTRKKNYIPWLENLIFTDLKNIDYKIFDYVIYAHSFTDGQMWFGYDGFENSVDWLEFTLKKFINTKKNILIKPHPNYYNNSLSIVAEWDKKIYDKITYKYKKYKNLYFLKSPIHNYLLLKKLNKKCVTISKHGTVLLENSYMKFKSISSTSNFFNKKFKISNAWSNREQYSNLLNYDYTQLNAPNKEDLLELVYALFYIYPSIFSNFYYENILKSSLNLKINEIHNKGRSSLDKSSLTKFNQINKVTENNVINKICKKIWEVRI
jgi:hypothetical protein